MSVVITVVGVTGASGFIGSAVVRALSYCSDYSLKLAVRAPCTPVDSAIQVVPIKSIEPDAQWGKFVADVDVIIHAAARVHVMNDLSADPEAEYQRINVAGTLNLAEQAAAAGVKRFIFIS